MEILAYIVRCIFMFIVTWAGVRFIGKKSIANMTSYDLAALMLLTTVAAEPLVFKISTKAAIGVFTLVFVTFIVGSLSLWEYFYHIDSSPSVIIVNGKIIEKEIRKVRLNIPLLMSELRLQGYQNLKDVAYAILEPNGKLSVVPTSQARPIQPSDMALTTGPTKLSFPVIIDGKLKEQNLIFSKKDKTWLMNQLNMCGVSNVEDVLFAQIDSSGNIYIDLKEKKVDVPALF